MKHTRQGLVSTVILLLILTCALTGQAKDVRPEQVIITAVSGSVTYVRPSESDEPQTVLPFLKLEEGDTLNLASDASMNVLFLIRGLGETWQGPKTLLFRNDQLLSQVRGVWTREHPKLLKALLFEPQKIMTNSTLLRLINQAGGTPRALPSTRELPTGEPEKTYDILRQEFGEDDATPNLYRLSVLFEYGQYDRMLPVLQDLLLVYPDNPILLGWKEWAESRENR